MSEYSNFNCVKSKCENFKCDDIRCGNIKGVSIKCDNIKCGIFTNGSEERCEMIQDIEARLPLSKFISPISFHTKDDNILNSDSFERIIKSNKKSVINSANNVVCKVSSFNIQGGYTFKMVQNSWVHDYLVKHDIDIAIVLETWYCEDANMPQFHKSMIVNGYRIKCIANAVKFNDNVGGRYAGGIWVICKDEWYDKLVTIDTDSPYYVIFKICELNLYCIGIYNPSISQSNVNVSAKALSIFPELTMKLQCLHDTDINGYIFIGDFNVHYGLDTGDSLTCNTNNELMVNELKDHFNLVNLNKQYQYGKFTRVGSCRKTICDYAFTNIFNDFAKIETFRVDYDYIMSDHFPIRLELKSQAKLKNNELNTFHSKYYLMVSDKDDDRLIKVIDEAMLILNKMDKDRMYNDNDVNIRINRFLWCMYGSMISYGILKLVRKSENDWSRVHNTQLNNNLVKIKNKIQEIIQKIATDHSNIDKQSRDQLKTLKKQFRDGFVELQREKVNIMLNKLDLYQGKFGDSKLIGYIKTMMRMKHDGPIECNGKILVTTIDKCEAWFDHYQNFFKFKRQVINSFKYKQVTNRIEEIRNKNKLRGKVNQELNKQFSNDEVLLFVRTKKFKTKLNKTHHWDKITNRIIKILVENHTDTMVELLNTVLNSGKIPDIWKLDRLSILLKRKPVTDMKNYRPIGIQSCLFKLLDALVCERIQKVVEPLLRPEQGGFRKNRSTSEQLMILRIIILHYKYVLNKDLYLLILDFTTAYDTVWQDGCLLKLYEFGINGPVWHLLDNFYHERKSSVSVNNVQSDVFDIERGLIEGGNSSPVSFNVYINDLIGKLHDLNVGIKLGSISLSSLGFADDLIALSESTNGIQLQWNCCAEWSFDNGLKFSSSKLDLRVSSNSLTESLLIKNNVKLNLQSFGYEDNNYTDIVKYDNFVQCHMLNRKVGGKLVKYLGLNECNGKDYRYHINHLIDGANNQIGMLIMNNIFG